MRARSRGSDFLCDRWLRISAPFPCSLWPAPVVLIPRGARIGSSLMAFSRCTLPPRQYPLIYKFPHFSHPPIFALHHRRTSRPGCRLPTGLLPRPGSRRQPRRGRPPAASSRTTRTSPMASRSRASLSASQLARRCGVMCLPEVSNLYRPCARSLSALLRICGDLPTLRRVPSHVSQHHETMHFLWF